MPGRVDQPTRASALGIYIATYTSPSSFPDEVWTALRQNERAANVILPQAQTVVMEGKQVSGQYWITCSTALSPTAKPRLEFILSCSEWRMGTYPVFIVSTLPTSSLTPSFLAPRVAMLVTELYACVRTERVYSIFAPAPLAKSFAQAWSNVTGVELEEYPYYAARFSHCSKRTFVDRSQSPSSLDLNYSLRMACEADIPGVAALCKGFASESDPFFLDDDGALKEAVYLVSNKFAWIHEVIHDGISEVACLVATTRNSDNVHTITKVYTPPKWRKRGCAERLVRHVSKYALFTLRKQWVVLYVAHNNPAAAKVYDKVGFSGLCGKPRVEGIDDWVEIGCRSAELGHW
ncbi:hypothetical protein M422DRAFT_221915 [Sphaerobolus stellatus SS14]|nr:hypothetical protein M422DRAFT_221915 [Sphaerobolus stellatus SS14]